VDERVPNTIWGKYNEYLLPSMAENNFIKPFEY